LGYRRAELGHHLVSEVGLRWAQLEELAVKSSSMKVFYNENRGLERATLEGVGSELDTLA
jgi:hypothetical protein